MSDLLEDLLTPDATAPEDDGWLSTHELVTKAGWPDTDVSHRKMLELIHLKAKTMERSRRQRPGRFGDPVTVYVYRKKS